MFTLETRKLENEEKDDPMDEWDSEMKFAEKGNWLR